MPLIHACLLYLIRTLGSNRHANCGPPMIVIQYNTIPSILEYGSVIWAGAADTHTARIDRVQHKFIMWLLSYTLSGYAPSLSYANLLHHFRLPSLSRFVECSTTSVTAGVSLVSLDYHENFPFLKVISLDAYFCVKFDVTTLRISSFRATAAVAKSPNK